MTSSISLSSSAVYFVNPIIASFLKLIKEMPLFCNSIFSKSSFNLKLDFWTIELLQTENLKKKKNLKILGLKLHELKFHAIFLSPIVAF